jgi:hypothetical protein
MFRKTLIGLTAAIIGIAIVSTDASARGGFGGGGFHGSGFHGGFAGGGWRGGGWGGGWRGGGWAGRLRTFECSKCDHVQKMQVEDLFKSTLGWLNGELGSPKECKHETDT